MKKYSSKFLVLKIMLGIIVFIMIFITMSYSIPTAALIYLIYYFLGGRIIRSLIEFLDIKIWKDGKQRDYF